MLIWRKINGGFELNIKIEKILVPVDGSKHSRRALEYACSLSEKFNSTVYVLHVVPMISTPSPYGDLTADQPYIALENAGEEILKDCKKFAEDLNCEIETLIARGDPAEQIINTALESDVDLVVMGRRGIGGLKRLLLGSVSDRVVQHLNCPVLLVKAK